jgi:hypothetical protein
VIKLSVSGLPQGYEAEFDAPRDEYWLTGTAPFVEHQVAEVIVSEFLPSLVWKTVYLPLGNGGKNQALLTISREGPTDTPPGDFTFDIIANSTQRANLELPNTTITKIATLNVPEIHDIDLKLDASLYNGIPVIAGNYFPIDFFGMNLGNVNDTVNVSASLDLGDSEKTWNEIFSLEPYGSTANQYYSGQFGFTYDRTDLFPNPGVYKLEITVNSSKTALIDKKILLFLNFTNAYGIKSLISPSETTVFANWQTNFTLVINNTGNVADNITIESRGWNESLTHPQRITNIEPMRPQEVIISLNISNPGAINPGTYNFRIEVKSESDLSLNAFSVHDINVTILAPDYVPPGIVQVAPGKPSELLIYPQSTLTLGPSFMAFDEWNDTYSIYIDDLLYKSGTWEEGIPIQTPVTGDNPLIPGLHNVTIAFRDKSFNTATAQVWIEIVDVDTTAPVITPLPRKITFPLNFSQSQSLFWNISEEFPYYYQILINGTPEILTLWDNFCMKIYNGDLTNFRFGYWIHPQTLTEGTWNITYVLQDMSNNFASDSVFITITGADNTPPGVTEFPISSAYLGNGTTFQLTATDTSPDSYSLWMGTTLLSSGTWDSGVPLVFNVDDIGIVVGNNDLKIELIDLAGNLVSYTWIFTLDDIDIPAQLAAPPNLILYEHNYTQLISPFWVVEDLDSQPGTFTINLDGVTISEGVWTNANGTFALPIPHLNPGIHHYDAYFRDATGNTLYSPIDLTLIDITKPVLTAVNNIHFEPLYSADWFEFYISELHPAQYSLYRNNTLVDSNSLSPDFPYVLVRFIDPSTGVYNYTIVVEDESGNIGQLSINVQVTDYNPPLIIKPFDMIISEGAQNLVITWEIREANPQDYSLYLNGALIESGILTVSSLTHSLTGLVIGEYIYTLVVYDTFGLSHTSTTYVTVVDMTPPTLSHVSDCRFLKNDPKASITWQAYDLHPSSYTVTTDGVAAIPVSWDGSEITIHCTGWTEGNYTVLLQVSDASGNIVSDEVEVEIFLVESSKTEPGISASGFEIFLVVVSLVLINLRFRRKKHSKRAY